MDISTIPMFDRTGRPITNPHLVTPKALKVIQGKVAIHLTDADWESYHSYYERMAIVDRIVFGVIKWHESKRAS